MFFIITRKFFVLLNTSIRGKPVLLVDVDGVLFYSPIVDVVRTLVCFRSTLLLRLTMRIYQSSRARRLMQKFIKLNTYAIALIRHATRKGHVVVYCTGRTIFNVPELMRELLRIGLPVHGIVSRTLEPLDNALLKTYAVVLLHRFATSIEVHDDSPRICSRLSHVSNYVYRWQCGRKIYPS